MMRLLLLCCLWLAGCASAPPTDRSIDHLLDDAAVAPPTVPIDPAAVLAPSPRMKAYLREVVEPRVGRLASHHRVIEALYDDKNLKLVYDTELTRNAAEAFDARRGNCLSLVLMTAALARELGLSVRFQSVEVEEAWGRDGDLVLFVGHVNLALGRSLPGRRVLDGPGDWLTIDFLPNADLSRQRSTEIEESRILAMYMNNKAVEALASGQVDDAYWWAREALRQDRGFVSAVNTLGVVHQRRGRPALAEAALRHVLSLEPTNSHALGNLQHSLLQQGRTAEAEEVARQLARLQPTTPFALLDHGRQAMDRGDYPQARRHFEQALRRGGDYHEFHFWLAQALAKLGDVAGAARQLELAREGSSTQRLQALYAGKLQRLREQWVH